MTAARLRHLTETIGVDVAALLRRIQSRPDYAGQLEHLEILPPTW